MMTHALNARQDLDRAVSIIIDEARRAGGVLRVGSSARALAAELGYGTDREADLVDVLSRQAMMHGIAIEFDTLPGTGP
ncbi:MAG: hypothetical protein ACO1OK_04130 [Devosia sp.]